MTVSDATLPLSFVAFALPDKDESGNEIKDEYSSLPFPSQYIQRLKAKVINYTIF